MDMLEVAIKVFNDSKDNDVRQEAIWAISELSKCGEWVGGVTDLRYTHGGLPSLMER